jgi:hypothetical protein
LFHRRQIEPREPHAAQHIGFEKPDPIGVGNGFERFRLEDAEVVHQDLDIRKSLKKVVGGGGRGEIASEALDIGARRGAQGGDNLVHGRLAATVDDHARAFLRKRLGDRKADAGGAAADHRQPVLQFKVHGFYLPEKSVGRRVFSTANRKAWAVPLVVPTADGSLC